METIHTDSAYRVFKSKDSSIGKIKISLDQSIEKDARRTLASSNVRQDTGDQNSAVSFLKYKSDFYIYLFLIFYVTKFGDEWILQIQTTTCPYTHVMSIINEKMENIGDVDSFVNYGFLLMLAVVGIFSWLSKWRWEASFIWFFL